MGAFAGIERNWASQTNGGRTHIATKGVVQSGLVLNLDAGVLSSYPGTGTAWTDLSGNGRNGTLTNGPTFNSANGGSLVFDGIDDFVSSVSNLTLANNFSVSLWLIHTNSYPVQEKYISLGSDRIVIQSNENGNLSSYVTDSTQQNLLVWGYNNAAQLGTNDTALKATPVTTFAGGTTWKQVACAYQHTAAIKTDGSLWTWGFNDRGHLGTNDGTQRSTPVTTFAGGNTWKQVSAGGFNTAAIKTDGTLWIWGRNNNTSTLGINLNSDVNRITPITTFSGGTTWKQVSAGNEHIAAIKTDGTLWTWGRNAEGQLGINAAGNSRSTPVTTFAGSTDWKSVSCGTQHTAAIKTDGTLWTWGRNAEGQLGDFSTTSRSTPVTTFSGGTNWKSVSGGYQHTAAIKTDGSLWTWGDGGNGRLGTNDGTRRSTPVTTFSGGTNWKQVSAAEAQTMAVKTDGTLWGWGQGNVGRLGTNGSNSVIPVTTFAGGNNWKQVSAANVTGAAIKTDGTFINDDDSNISLLNTKYYNISLTCNGTTIKIHLDSTEILSTTINGTLTSTDVSFTVSSLLDCFKGNLSQALIYNRALTAGEIQQNFNATRSRFGV